MTGEGAKALGARLPRVRLERLRCKVFAHMTQRMLGNVYICFCEWHCVPEATQSFAHVSGGLGVRLLLLKRSLSRANVNLCAHSDNTKIEFIFGTREREGEQLSFSNGIFGFQHKIYWLHVHRCSCPIKLSPVCIFKILYALSCVWAGGGHIFGVCFDWQPIKRQNPDKANPHRYRQCAEFGRQVTVTYIKIGN